MLPSKIGPLYRGTLTNVNKTLDTYLRPHGIGYGQLDYLMIISESAGINQNDICSQLNVGKASVTKAVKVLLKAGLIKREIDLDDRRNFKLYISEECVHIIEELTVLRDRINGHLFTNLSDEDRRQFIEYLEIVYDNSRHIPDILSEDD